MQLNDSLGRLSINAAVRLGFIFEIVVIKSCLIVIFASNCSAFVVLMDSRKSSQEPAKPNCSEEEKKAADKGQAEETLNVTSTLIDFKTARDGYWREDEPKLGTKRRVLNCPIINWALL